MKKIVAIPIVLLLLFFALIVVGALIDTGISGHPTLPVKSEANKVIVTSNGCCMWAENVLVYLMDDDGNKTLISKNDRVNENDIFEREITQVNYSPIHLMVEIDLYYDEQDKFSSQVLDFADFSEIKKNGILIYIQEADGAYINVISGETHISYKLNHEHKAWELKSEPNKIFAD